MSDEVEYCDECGWRHANIARCWRNTLREAREKLADPTLDPHLRTRLQAAMDKFEADRATAAAFFAAANDEMLDHDE